MPSAQHVDNEFSSRFSADVFQLYPQSSRQYRCTDISDIHYSAQAPQRLTASIRFATA